VEALNRLIARDNVFYKKALFRAFFGMGKKELDRLTMRQYIDYNIVLRDVLNLWHAPFQKD